MGIYMSIPTWDNGVWKYTMFSDKKEFREYIKSIFKEPGQYQFDETVLLWNEHARMYQDKKMFCTAPEGSRDYQIFWDTEKEKCRKGVIYKNGDREWYLCRDYYMWINYLPIYDKVKGKFDFPTIWDSQYHAFLYEILAMLHSNHVVELKKRQWGNTYMKIAKIVNRFWFEEGFTAKMGASLKDYINEKGAWKFLNQYRDFLNKNTAWYRTVDPERVFSWQQRQQVRENGRVSYIGLKSSISGTSFEKDATAGVGGNISMFYHEEAGIAPKMDTTYEFMRPALSSGGILTGQFIAAGSVGDLDQCKPLREIILNPSDYEFYGVETNLFDSKGTIRKCGLFIPEQWSYTAAAGEEENEENQKLGIIEEPCIDQWGNSLVEKALESILRRRARWEKTLSPEKYQLRISQHPINIEEAFAIRKTSVFPVKYTVPQIRRVEENEYPLEYVELERGADGKITTKPSTRIPNIYPTEVKSPDKRGVVCIRKHPDKNAKPLFTHLGSVDSVAKGVSKNSESLASIYIYEIPTQVTKKFQDGTSETFMEGGNIVAWWTGRYEDIMETNECMSMLVEYYQAYTTCEINQASWIDYMRLKRRTKYLALKEDMTFDAESGVRQGTIFKYGWYNTTAIWGKMLEYGINSLSNIMSCSYDENENPIHIKYGVERISDIWLLKEMQDYDPKTGNYDRVIAYCALMAFAELRLTMLGGAPEIERKEDIPKLDTSKNIYTFNGRPHPYHNLMGGDANNTNKYKGYKRNNPFKHLR